MAEPFDHLMAEAFDHLMGVGAPAVDPKLTVICLTPNLTIRSIWGRGRRWGGGESTFVNFILPNGLPWTRFTPILTILGPKRSKSRRTWPPLRRISGDEHFLLLFLLLKNFFWNFVFAGSDRVVKFDRAPAPA